MITIQIKAYNQVEIKLISMNKTLEAASSQSSSKNIPSDLALYKIPYKGQQKSRKSRASFDTSLPFISPFTEGAKHVKINTIRRQSQDTEQQITLMKARLHALKQMKSKIELKKQKSLQKIQLLQTFRERRNFQSMQKLKQKEKQSKELQELKQKAKQMRQGMKKQILKARQTIYLKNMSMAYMKKQQQVGFSDQILLKQQKQLQQKLEKIQRIKQQQAKHNEILKEFHQSRIKFAQQNHITKAEKELIERERKRKNLERLKEEHLKYVEELKAVEKEYEEITKLNPEGELNTKSSRVSMMCSRRKDL